MRIESGRADLPLASHHHDFLLRRLAEALSRAAGTHGVVQAALDVARSELGVDGVWIATATPDGVIQILDARGYSGSACSAFRSLQDAGPEPLARALRTGEPVTFGTCAELAALWPAAARLGHGMEAGMLVPANGRGGLAAALCVTWIVPRIFDERERMLWQAAAALLGEALERARHFEEARQAQEALQRMLAIVSHDLRSPLAAICTAAGLLARAGLPDRELARVRRILASGSKMNQLIRDLLDYSASTLGQGIAVHPRPTDLHHVCSEVLAELEQAYPGRRIVYDAEGEGTGTWDPLRLQQVVGNLLSNALQHGAEGSDVSLTWRGDHRSCEIAVHNDGAPIPAGMLPHLFTPFRSTGDDGSGNLGLGLYIVDRIVAAHGGTVDVTSTQEEGTTFRVRLPTWCPTREPPARDHPASARLAR